MLLQLKKRSIVFINFLIILIVSVNAEAQSINQKVDIDTLVLYENKMLSDAMKIAVPAVVFGTVLTIALNKDFRWYFADRWTRFTSPNHAEPDQYREFYWKPWSEEIAQETQCDKGVHFIFSYLPVMPIATLLDRSYYSLSSGKIKTRLSDWSMLSASAIVVGFGLMEEYMDGHQIGEGFDVFDFTANASGVACALLKHYGKLDGITFYWSFNREMFSNSDYAEKWPWWIYMAGYEFYVNINVAEIIEKSKNSNNALASIIETVGYLPDFSGFWKLKYNYR